MKITRVTPLVLGTAWRNLTFLQIETDEGITGYAEANCLHSAARRARSTRMMPCWVTSTRPCRVT